MSDIIQNSHYFGHFSEFSTKLTLREKVNGDFV